MWTKGLPSGGIRGQAVTASPIAKKVDVRQASSVAAISPAISAACIGSVGFSPESLPGFCTGLPHTAAESDQGN
jgi:hypothetical protein